ncbi:hypothetical protein [Seleniivibrio woodruffii]|uniref:hypothetical protein n=1 Tax=Seleniivibrio woodruffii TaxID=1078050 RepID=UPI0026ED06D3|nr:hypothetical protein [Seleniivibrio woodruffii]
MEYVIYKSVSDLNNDIARLKSERVSAAAEIGKHYSKDLSEHFEIIRKDFTGRSALAYETARMIVFLRRNMDTDVNSALFLHIAREHSGHICKEMNLRWLVSVMDTLADFGDAEESASALQLSCMVNFIKLSETEKKFFYTENLSPLKDEDGHIYPLFDGLTHFKTVSGDMVRNLFGRISKKMRQPHMLEYYTEIKNRPLSEKNCLGRFNETHKNLLGERK